MSEMSLREQIQCIEAMESDLRDFCRLMRDAMDSFQNDIKYLRSNGLSTEKEEEYQRDYYAPANNDVNQVINDIYGPHLHYLDEVLDYLKRALNS